jgi:phosphomannomutase
MMIGTIVKSNLSVFNPPGCRYPAKGEITTFPYGRQRRMSPDTSDLHAARLLLWSCIDAVHSAPASLSRRPAEPFPDGYSMTSPFKAYDVRGTLPDQINVPFAYRFGQAVAVSRKPHSVVVGHDMRGDSPALAAALAEGLIDCGATVLPLGLCGTEEVYFQTAALEADAGLMVTASHNPPEYNGIKMVLQEARPATRENALDAIEALVMSGGDMARSSSFSERGTLARAIDRGAYVDRLLAQVEGKPLQPLKIVCHAGNGCAGPVIDRLEQHLPFTFIKVDHEPDPALPNGVPNPLLPEKRERASRAVIDHEADLGIAWDGDFDRCFFYDHTGAFVEGYYLVGLIAAAMLRESPGATILHDPRLVWNTMETVSKAGGKALACKTGHAFFKHEMRANDAIYGGEMSAHHYFRDFSFCDSGMLTWLTVVAEMSRRQATLAEMVGARIAAFPCSGEINFVVADSAATQARIADRYLPLSPQVDSLDGLSMAFDDWRFNLRASNTEPMLRLNVETRGDAALLTRKTEELSRLIRSA